MIKKLIFISSILLAGCASTGVIPTGPDSYMIGKRSSQAGFGPPLGTKGDVYREANEFCTKQNKMVETINLGMVNSSFGRPGSVNLEFRCVESGQKNKGPK